MVLPCGHHEACMYRYMHKGVRKKYCMACIVEAHPEAEINAIRIAEQVKKELEEQKARDKKKETVSKPIKKEDEKIKSKGE